MISVLLFTTSVKFGVGLLKFSVILTVALLKIAWFLLAAIPISVRLSGRSAARIVAQPAGQPHGLRH